VFCLCVLSVLFTEKWCGGSVPKRIQLTSLLWRMARVARVTFTRFFLLFPRASTAVCEERVQGLHTVLNNIPAFNYSWSERRGSRHDHQTPADVYSVRSS
jgi:hypothetical protein